MSRTDRLRITSAIIMASLGAVIVVRAVVAQVLPAGILGMVMIALGLYRLNQLRRFRAGAGTW